MTRVLVTGGTGHLGRDIVARLLHDDHQVRVLARSPGRPTSVEWAIGDLATGEGLREAVQGVHTVIHAATDSPIARRGSVRFADVFSSPSAVDVQGTERLLALCRKIQVQHFLHVSIVGLEDASLPYARVKLAGEKLVRDSALSWSVVRATPFYYLLAKFLAGMSWLPVWPLPTAPFNLVDTADVASHLVQCAFDGRRGERAEIGGPDDLSLAELARQYQTSRHIRRAIAPFRLSERSARRMGFVVSKGARGTLSWQDWLSREFAGEQVAA